MEVKVIKHDNNGAVGLQIGVWGCPDWKTAEDLLRAQLDLLAKYPVIPVGKERAFPKLRETTETIPTPPAPSTEGKMIGNQAECLKFIHEVDQRFGEERAREILGKFGAKKISELKGDDHPLFIKACSEALGEVE